MKYLFFSFMNIRIANINDLRLVRKIEKASFNKFAYSTNELKNMLSQKNSMTLIYENQIPLGYISFIKVDDIFGEIESIAIIPSAKRTGIGTILLKEYEKIMMKEGVKRSVLEVRIHNRKAIKFYEKHNYKIIDNLKNFYSMSYRGSRDAYLMEKFLF
ncbi:MAG: GNAT family N-acetyltransferase [Thermoplasmata archaeon]